MIQGQGTGLRVQGALDPERNRPHFLSVPDRSMGQNGNIETFKNLKDYIFHIATMFTGAAVDHFSENNPLYLLELSRLF